MLQKYSIEAVKIFLHLESVVFVRHIKHVSLSSSGNTETSVVMALIDGYCTGLKKNLRSSYKSRCVFECVLRRELTDVFKKHSTLDTGSQLKVVSGVLLFL